ncbi:MAG: GatB/YqeY domain-containing protein [Candidatus Brocadiaceae bacterium]|nr:GatB/YqeY domain-containing protein [Candidatus Brocadiaceae bacterium]
MDLKLRITEDLKISMKAQDKLRTSVLRMLLADIKIGETSGRPKDQINYTEIVRGYYKKLKKACEEYERLGISEKTKMLGAEIAIVEEYLPRQLSDDEMKRIVDDVVEENNYTAKETGIAMKRIMSKYGATVDGKKIQLFLKEKLR